MDKIKWKEGGKKFVENNSILIDNNKELWENLSFIKDQYSRLITMDIIITMKKNNIIPEYSPSSNINHIVYETEFQDTNSSSVMGLSMSMNIEYYQKNIIQSNIKTYP